MSLRERLEKKKLRETVLTIDGDAFLVKELSKSQRADMLAACRDANGKADPNKIENAFLCVCVCDPDSGVAVFDVSEKDAWNAVGSGITGPLFAEVMKLNGMDNDDVGRAVKNSETTGS